MLNAAKHHSLGLVLGKFMPPHHGHRLVIRTALAQSERVVLVVCKQADDPIPADLRAGWLRQLYPPAIVTVLNVTWPITDDAAWATGVVAVVGETPAAVFSSDLYAERLAGLLGCAHVMVDKERSQVPISASLIRQDPMEYREFLDPLVYRYFSRRAGRKPA